ncbi:unnamed protein product [Amoebophrya sp. A120]|nr:unnamed protein product [Amoebophrya sp. A120]|eukprot:GSA120T00004671001.1
MNLISTGRDSGLMLRRRSSSQMAEQASMGVTPKHIFDQLASGAGNSGSFLLDNMNLKRKIHVLLENRSVTHFIHLSICLSILCVIFETHWRSYEEFWNVMEIYFTTIFTIEFGLRWYAYIPIEKMMVNARWSCRTPTSDDENAYLSPYYRRAGRFDFLTRSWLNLLDFFSILPLYLSAVFSLLDLVLSDENNSDDNSSTTSNSSSSNEQHAMDVINALRVLRIFRLMKILRNLNPSGFYLMYQTLKRSYTGISILAFFLSVFLCLFSSVMYYAEMQECPSKGLLLKDFRYEFEGTTTASAIAGGATILSSTSTEQEILAEYREACAASTSGFTKNLPFLYPGRNPLMFQTTSAQAVTTIVPVGAGGTVVQHQISAASSGSTGSINAFEHDMSKAYLCCDLQQGHEASENFPSVLAAAWWAVVTMTTVGYGDYVPVTFFGKVVGMITMLSGILVISMPAAIIGSKFQEVLEEYELRRYKTLKNNTSGSSNSGVEHQGTGVAQNRDKTAEHEQQDSNQQAIGAAPAIGTTRRPSSLKKFVPDDLQRIAEGKEEEDSGAKTNSGKLDEATERIGSAADKELSFRLQPTRLFTTGEEEDEKHNLNRISEGTAVTSTSQTEQVIFSTAKGEQHALPPPRRSVGFHSEEEEDEEDSTSVDASSLHLLSDEDNGETMLDSDDPRTSDGHGRGQNRRKNVNSDTSSSDEFDANLDQFSDEFDDEDEEDINPDNDNDSLISCSTLQVGTTNGRDDDTSEDEIRHPYYNVENPRLQRFVKWIDRCKGAASTSTAPARPSSSKTKLSKKQRQELELKKKLAFASQKQLRKMLKRDFFEESYTTVKTSEDQVIVQPSPPVVQRVSSKRKSSLKKSPSKEKVAMAKVVEGNEGGAGAAASSSSGAGIPLQTDSTSAAGAAHQTGADDTSNQARTSAVSAATSSQMHFNENRTSAISHTSSTSTHRMSESFVFHSLDGAINTRSNSNLDGNTTTNIVNLVAQEQSTAPAAASAPAPPGTIPAALSSQTDAETSENEGTTKAHLQEGTHEKMIPTRRKRKKNEKVMKPSPEQETIETRWNYGAEKLTENLDSSNLANLGLILADKQTKAGKKYGAEETRKKLLEEKRRFLLEQERLANQEEDDGSYDWICSSQKWLSGNDSILDLPAGVESLHHLDDKILQRRMLSKGKRKSSKDSGKMKIGAGAGKTSTTTIGGNKQEDSANKVDVEEDEYIEDVEYARNKPKPFPPPHLVPILLKHLSNQMHADADNLNINSNSGLLPATIATTTSSIRVAGSGPLSPSAGGAGTMGLLAGNNVPASDVVLDQHQQQKSALLEQQSYTLITKLYLEERNLVGMFKQKQKEARLALKQVRQVEKRILKLRVKEARRQKKIVNKLSEYYNSCREKNLHSGGAASGGEEDAGAAAKSSSNDLAADTGINVDTDEQTAVAGI